MDAQDLGFEYEDDLLEYLTSLRDRALLGGNGDNALDAFVEDLSSEKIELSEAIPGAELYFEFVSSDATNSLSSSDGYEVEATIVSKEIAYWYPNLIDSDEAEDLVEFWDDLRKSSGMLVTGNSIVLHQEISLEESSVLSAMVFNEEDFENLKTVPVGFPAHGLNVSEVDLSENKFVFRLFGKVSGRIKAISTSEAKEIFTKTLKECFSFIDGNPDIYNHKYFDGTEFEISKHGEESWNEAWLIPVEYAFANIREPR